MNKECPFCKARETLRKAQEILEEIPEIGSAFYDQPIEDLVNGLSNAMSTFQCMCDESILEKQS